MKKTIINIPAGVQYLSEIKGFELPNGIFNKVLTGCGGSHLALTDNNPTILCSPRISLIRSKVNQHADLFWFQANTKPKELLSYLESVAVPKIAITYDSLFKLEKLINVDDYRVVVDEFQRLLTDSSFKGDTEVKAIRALGKYKYVTYLSATPILEKYLDSIELFNDIPYYEACWECYDNVDVELIKSPNPKLALVRFINQFKSGKFYTFGDTQCKEIVFYINSVTDIINVVKTTKLAPEEVNILCAESNEKFISKLGKGFKLGSLPNKGEAHKMFTFCTSAAFDGVDMYSTNAMSVVITDYKIDNLLMSISTDLVQIAGRQRLDENPFRNKLTLVYCDGMSVIELEEKRESLKIKVRNSEIDVEETNKSQVLDLRFQDWSIIPSSVKYVNSYKVWVDDKFELNNMVHLAEIYKIDLCEDFLKNGIKKAIGKSERFVKVGADAYIKYTEKIKYTLKKTEFTEQLKAYCEYMDSNDGSMTLFIEENNQEIVKYYQACGGIKCRALGYQKSKLDKFLISKEEVKITDVKPFIKLRDFEGFLTATQIKEMTGCKTAKNVLECDFLNVIASSKKVDGKSVKGYNFKLNK